jgi:outer membrane protein OmpA-like peptidoglycan-associated protein
VKEIRKDLGEDAGDVLMTPDGAIILQVHGLSFSVGSAQLKPGQEALVGKLVEAIGRFPGAKVRVEGHTDDTGNRAANLALSEQRAQTVATQLAKKLGIAADQIPTVGYGPDKPVAPNSTPEGRARNRRIDVVITPEG